VVDADSYDTELKADIGAINDLNPDKFAVVDSLRLWWFLASLPAEEKKAEDGPVQTPDSPMEVDPPAENVDVKILAEAEEKVEKLESDRFDILEIPQNHG